jgi:hypothetical protein
VGGLLLRGGNFGVSRSNVVMDLEESERRFCFILFSMIHIMTTITFWLVQRYLLVRLLGCDFKVALVVLSPQHEMWRLELWRFTPVCRGDDLRGPA